MNDEEKIFQTSAQGLFGSKETPTVREGEGDNSNQGTQETPTPLGSGLLIMMAAGAGYAVIKKKEK